MPSEGPARLSGEVWLRVPCSWKTRLPPFQPSTVSVCVPPTIPKSERLYHAVKVPPMKRNRPESDTTDTSALALSLNATLLGEITPCSKPASANGFNEPSPCCATATCCQSNPEK